MAISPPYQGNFSCFPGSGQKENDGRILSSSLFDYYSLEVSVRGDLKCHRRSISIRVKGYLDPERSGWLDGLAIIHTTTGETLLSGPIVDQAALPGVLLNIRDLGPPLLAVKCSSSARDDGLVNS